jgi:hypothetical protein
MASKRTFECATADGKWRGEYDARFPGQAAQSFAEGCAVPVGKQFTVRAFQRGTEPRERGHLYQVVSRSVGAGVLLRRLHSVA